MVGACRAVPRSVGAAVVREFIQGWPHGTSIHLHALDAVADELRAYTRASGPGDRMPLLQRLIDAHPPLPGDIVMIFDDDVVFVPLGDSDPAFELAFVVKTNNPWGIGVAKDRPEILAALDDALATVIADGRLRSVWQQWLPTLDYPFEVR